MKPSSFGIKNSRQQRGLSLIELMIAMTIGSFLILGITQIFISNQTSYLFQQSQLGNQENGRFTLAVLEQELSKAGYRSQPRFPFAASSGVVNGCNFAQSTSVSAVSATSLCIQYQASNVLDTACQGTALPATAVAQIIKPYNQVNPVLVENIALDTATNSITCTTGGNTQQLVTGVRDIRFDYGAGDSAGGASKTVTSFSTAPGTLAIGAVRYTALLQSSGGSTLIRDTATISPALANWNTRYGTNYVDNTRIYQIVQGTVMIRNQMP
ncbi:MAG: prepilin-type N-terminal cleavage/methylation domain-containing protein [Pseudomonas sp.]